MLTLKPHHMIRSHDMDKMCYSGWVIFIWKIRLVMIKLKDKT